MKLLVVAGADLHPKSITLMKIKVHDSEIVVGRYIANSFPDEARELLEEIARQKSLKKAKTSEQEENSPPRKRQRLAQESDVAKLLLPDS